MNNELQEGYLVVGIWRQMGKEVTEIDFVKASREVAGLLIEERLLELGAVDCTVQLQWANDINGAYHLALGMMPGDFPNFTGRIYAICAGCDGVLAKADVSALLIGHLTQIAYTQPEEFVVGALETSI